MLLELQRTIKEELQSTIKRVFDFELDFSDITAEYPPKTEMGDLAFPIAFEIAKRIKAATGAKQNPRQLAEKLREQLGVIDGISRIETAGAGYLNFFFDRGKYLKSLQQAGRSLALDEITGGKLIVEHTSINPNKAAHIGHLRNAVLGDTIVRLMQASGEQVEIHNYIDNTGVQVADVVVGFKYIEHKSIEDIAAIQERFDHYCWDLYARVGKFYEESQENQKLRAQTLHEIEHNTGEAAQMAGYISQRILKCHLETMLRLDIVYNLLPRESDILHLNFWHTAFEKLKASNAIYYETEGRNKGCWVMHAETKAEPAQDQTSAAETGVESQYEADKILVRSNGTVTYTGKDIAYHLWKLGHLGLDFSYRPFYSYPDGSVAWITSTDNQVEGGTKPPAFGNGVAYFNVIDVGQSYPQAYVKLGVKLLSSDQRVERSSHLAYEKVVLTPASARELGYELSEAESKRSQISMSGRKGLGVKADDLIDKLEEKARAEVDKRHQAASEEERKIISHQIAVSALRYFLLKYTRNSIIAFDFDEALAFEGETGPYIQYALVRIGSIFRKLEESKESPDEWLKDAQPERLVQLLSLKEEETGWNGDYLWSLIYHASRLKDVLRTSVKMLEPTHIAKYAHQLAGNFNEFYNASTIQNGEKKPTYKVIAEPDSDRRYLLIALVEYVRQQLELTLGLLGIEVPEKM
jgi:arginyl-tRNA synthetase